MLVDGGLHEGREKREEALLNRACTCPLLEGNESGRGIGEPGVALVGEDNGARLDLCDWNAGDGRYILQPQILRVRVRVRDQGGDEKSGAAGSHGVNAHCSRRQK